MVTEIILGHRHYIGTAAELGGITGVCGDTAYSTDLDVFSSWQGTLWVPGGCPFYVPLPVAAPVKVIGDFTKNGAYQVDDLNLSLVCPVGAIIARLRLHYKSNAAGHIGSIRTNATDNAESLLHIITQAANVDIMAIGEVNLDANRLLDYSFDANTTALNLFLLGYYVRRCL